MGSGDVLSSFATAEDITAEMIWSDKPVSLPTSSDIKVESELVRVDAATKARLLAMLSSSAEYDDDGSPCLCYFQPQLRLCWLSADRKSSYSILVSGVSHGEIQSFRDGEMQGMVRDGAFIPAYLGILDQLFPGHQMIPGLKRLEEERQKARANQERGSYKVRTSSYKGRAKNGGANRWGWAFAPTGGQAGGHEPWISRGEAEARRKPGLRLCEVGADRGRSAAWQAAARRNR